MQETKIIQQLFFSEILSMCINKYISCSNMVNKTSNTPHTHTLMGTWACMHSYIGVPGEARVCGLECAPITALFGMFQRIIYINPLAIFI